MTEATGKRTGRGRLLVPVILYGIGGHVPQVVSFLLMPVYTRYLDPNQMGVLEVCIAARVLAGLMMRFGLPGAIARLYFDEGDEPGFRSLTWTVFVAVVVTATLEFALALAIGPFVSDRLFPSIPFFPFLALTLAGAWLQAMSDFQRRILQAQERAKTVSTLNLVSGLLGIAVNVFFIVGLKWGISGALWADVYASGALFVVAVWMHRHDLSGQFSKVRLINAMRYGLPLIPLHLATWLQEYAWRWVLLLVAPTAYIGQLAVAAKLATPIRTVAASFSNAYSPVYFSWRTTTSVAEASSRVRSVASSVVVIGGIAVIGASTFGPIVVAHALDPAYLPAAYLVGTTALAAYLRLLYPLIVGELLFLKMTSTVSLVFFIGSVASFASLALLVPSLGAQGGAIAQCFGAGISLIGAAIIARRTMPLPVSLRVGIVTFFGCAVALGTTSRIGDFSSTQFAVASTSEFVGVSVLVVMLSGARDEFVGTTRYLLSRVGRLLLRRA